MLRIVLFLILFLVACQTASAGVVRVADGDCVGLSTSVTAAAQGAGTTTILLARNGTYTACGVVVTSGNVEIDGQGATFQFLGANVGTGASLSVRNASIVGLPVGANFSTLCGVVPDPAGGITGSTSAICNDGTLLFDAVSFYNYSLRAGNCDNGALSHICAFYPLIYSAGDLIFRNVTISLGNTFLTKGGGVLLVKNDHSAEVYNSTFISFGYDNFIVSSSTGTAVAISNTLFAAEAGPICYGPTTSLGGNVTNDISCGLSEQAGDKVAQGDLGLGSFGNNGGLVPTQALAFGGPAHGVGVAQYCEALDARGYTRATNSCDAGAYEYGGGSGALTANGMNGVYYDNAANGHYVTIQRIHDNGDVMVIWNTFDQHGNPAWIYGVGQISAKHIHVQMAQNLGGVLQVGGPAIGSTVRAWGAVDIDLTSCLLAQFNYQSSLPEFGSGQFPLTRLAIVADFGCSD